MALDVTGMDPDELEELLHSAQNEKTRRASRDEAERRMDEALQDRLNTEGHPPGSPWIKPDGPSSSYPREFIVSWNGGYRRSVVSVNMAHPDDIDHWHPLLVEAPTPTPPESVPSEEDDAEIPGELVKDDARAPTPAEHIPEASWRLHRTSRRER